jgi:hypothetical protein
MKTKACADDKPGWKHVTCHASQNTNGLMNLLLEVALVHAVQGQQENTLVYCALHNDVCQVWRYNNTSCTALQPAVVGRSLWIDLPFWMRVSKMEFARNAWSSGKTFKPLPTAASDAMSKQPSLYKFGTLLAVHGQANGVTTRLSDHNRTQQLPLRAIANMTERPSTYNR